MNEALFLQLYLSTKLNKDNSDFKIIKVADKFAVH
jgi:hypothetical protein